MYRIVMLASVVVLAAISANCARGDGGTSGASSSMVAPSPIGDGATAARPAGGGSSSLTLVMYTDKNGNGLPNWSDTVTFNVSTTQTTQPTVNLACSRGGVVVATGSAGFYDSYPFSWARLMTLSSQSWTSGAADCTATLGYYSHNKFSALTSIGFHVYE